MISYSFVKQIITNCDLLNSMQKYENIPTNELRIIKFNNYKVLENFIQLENHKVIINQIGTYKIKYNFCWEVIGEKNSIQNFLKSGILIFVYNDNKLIKNSVKFFKGFPYLNTSCNNFLISNLNSLELVFVIHLIGINSKISILPYSEGSFIEIEKI